MAAHPSLRLTVPIAVGCCLLSFIYLVISSDPTIGLYDEGIILFDAQRITDGDVIHRDFYSNYGPGQFYILSALFRVLSPSILIERLWDAFARSVSVAVIALIVVRSTGSVVAALGTAAACMVWLGWFEFYGYPVFPALAAVLTGVLFLLPAFELPHSARCLPAAGLCAGVAVLFRYDIGISSTAIMAGMIGLHAITQPSPPRPRVRDLIRRIGLFAGGAALIVLPLICVLIAVGAISDLIFDVVTYPRHFYYATRSLPFPGPRQLANNPSDSAVYLPLCLVAFALAMLASKIRDRRGDFMSSAVPWTLGVLIALTLIYYVKGFVRVSPIHMSMAIVTSLALTGVTVAGVTPRRGMRRTASSAALAMVVVFTLGAFARNAAQAGRVVRAVVSDSERTVLGAQFETIRPSCDDVTGLRRLACFSMDQDHLDALAFLDAHAKPGEYVFVGNGRHDKIFINDVALYFFARLRSATKWHQFDPGLQTSEPIQQEMIGELERNRPTYVVLETQWDTANEPNASALSSGVTLLDHYIAQNFHPTATFGAISVLERDQRP